MPDRSPLREFFVRSITPERLAAGSGPVLYSWVPELAEVEFFRKQWDPGVKQRILSVKFHGEKRIFRTAHRGVLDRLPGTVLIDSEAKGKQMLFRFSHDVWLGLHLGMTGKLSTAEAAFVPGKHDHLVLYQQKRALIFTDPRQFGRVQTHQASDPPDWWTRLPPAVHSEEFEREDMEAFITRHPKLPIKGILLLQAGFPGVGNWMADEILWRAHIDPRERGAHLTPEQLRALWRALRFVCRGALRHVGDTFGDPPRGWLFHQRWHKRGHCPTHLTLLTRETVAGRTTAWCDRCQALERSARS